MGWMNFLNVILESEELFVAFTVTLPQICIIIMITFLLYNAIYMKLQHIENAEEKRSRHHALFMIMLLVNAILMLLLAIYHSLKA
jgi:hypothetical protein